MGYVLGVDLGTTYTAAAIGRDARVEMLSLGNRAASIPSVVYIREDDEILVGEAADRRGAGDPGRVAREFKRRVGDTTPILVGGTPYSAEALMAKLLRWVIDHATEREGAAPDHVAVTHPANWGAYKKDLLEQAVRIANLEGVTFLTEPEAAASYYASTERVELGAVVAVYDLGGGTFDATVLRKTADGFEILGHPEGIERLGGIDFDEAVFQHVNSSVGDVISQLDPDDPNAVSAVARLRGECVEAKEALSHDTDAAIPVMLPNVSTEVRITRGELENMVRLRLSDTIDAMQRALRSAGVDAAHVTTVLLVGGSSRMPLVAQLVSTELGRPVAVDAHPKHSIALGAALAATSASAPTAAAAEAASAPATGAAGTAAVAGAAGAAAGAAVAGAATAPAVDATADQTAPVAPAIDGDSAVAAAPPGGTTETVPAAPPGAGAPPLRRTESDGGGGKRAALIGGIVAAVVIIGIVVAFFALSGGSGDDASSTSTTGGTETTIGDTTTTVQQVGPLSSSCGERSPCVQITSITEDGADYSVAFETIGYEPGEPVDDNEHIHFYWNTEDEQDVGTNAPASQRGQWVVYGGSSPFTGMVIADKPSDADGICASQAKPDHSVVEGTGTCFPLPS